MMSIEPRNEPRMLRWFRKTYPSYNLQPLLLPRTGGGAGLQQLAWGAQAGAGGAAAPGRREPADGGRAPPSCATRAVNEDFCAEKCYYSCPYIHIRTGVIAFLHGSALKNASSSAYIDVGTGRIVFPSPYDSKWQFGCPSSPRSASRSC